METKIVIFLAFTSVTLIFNSLVIWLAYKALANVTSSITEAIRELETSDDVRYLVQALQSASERAISMTEAGKQKLTEFDPVLAGVQARYSFRLAQVDVQCERSFSRIQHEVARVHNAIVDPAERVGATLAGVQGVLGYLSAERNDVGANPRLKR